MIPQIPQNISFKKAASLGITYMVSIYGGSKANKSNSQAASGDHQIVPAHNTG